MDNIIKIMKILQMKNKIWEIVNKAVEKNKNKKKYKTQKMSNHNFKQEQLESPKFKIKKFK